MSNLFDEAPEALEFCQAVEGDISRYKLFDEEQFAELRGGVLSTTGIDLQGERFTIKALEEGFARSTKMAFGYRFSMIH